MFIQFPDHSFRIKNENGKEIIFDELRKRWVRLTPEEWVRQNFILYLIQELKYPMALIGVEKEIALGQLKKRFDLLVFDAHHQPWMLIECKAMHIPLEETVLNQLLRYHQSVPVAYLVITNGSYTKAWKKENSRLMELNQLPLWPAL